MRRYTVFFLAAFLTMLAGLAPAHAMPDYYWQYNWEKPMFESAKPKQITVGTHGTLDIYIYGKNLNVDPDSNSPYDPRWNARRTYIYVRSTATGSKWRLLDDPVQDLGYSASDAVGYVASHASGNNYIYLELNLPRAKYTSKVGTLEVKMQKRHWREGDNKMESESNILRIPIMKDVSYTNTIDSIIPQAFTVNPKGQLLILGGDFAPGAVVYVNHKPVKIFKFDPHWTNIQVKLPSIGHQMLCTVEVRDAQGARSRPSTFWVYAPTAVTQVQPTMLTAGSRNTLVKIRYRGHPPAKAEYRVDPIRSVTSVHKGAKTMRFQPRLNLPGHGSSASYQGSSNKPGWHDLPMFEHKGEVRVTLPAVALGVPGTVHVRLTTPDDKKNSAIATVKVENASQQRPKRIATGPMTLSPAKPNNPSSRQPPRPQKPGSASFHPAHPHMSAPNVKIVRETYRVDRSCRNMHRLIVFDVTVRNDGGPLAMHQWSLYVMEGGGAGLGSGSVWVPPLAPHARAHVSIPVNVLQSHVTQLPGTHWLKLISTDSRTHRKTTTALRPITLSRGICQPTMHKSSPAGARMQPGMHLNTHPSPKLNPQPEPPSSPHRPSSPATRFAR
jgi:hypothetical protein